MLVFFFFFDIYWYYNRIFALEWICHNLEEPKKNGHKPKCQSLVMFNRVAQRDVVTSHNIQDNMSRSRKRTPFSCVVCCKSQKRGKQVCNRKFRRQEHRSIRMEDYEKLPFSPIEVMNPWDLGGDGKAYFHGLPTDEWFIRLMRK